MFDVLSLKPVLTALALPPVPFLLMVLLGARLMATRRWLGWLVTLPAVALLWLGHCNGAAVAVQDLLLRPPATLRADTLLEWKTGQRAGTATPPTAIVVLGGGRERHAPEYGGPNLSPASMARLRYGLWLARETGLPVAFTGGVGWAGDGAIPEAEVADQIARGEYNRPLRWVEARSRDTRENADLTVPMLRDAGIRELVIVTHAWHMPRALRFFRAAAGEGITVVPAPMGAIKPEDRPVMDWLPSGQGAADVRNALRELLARGVQR